jgi:hypothetical protein
MGNGKPVFGLSAEWLLHDGRLVPTSIVLSHDEQLQRLRAACPVALPAAVVAGDPCFDRMLASEPLRDTYRAAFGLTDRQRLIFVSSTWGARSLFGARPELVAHLRAELPLDEYTIALALHPNTWFGHSPWQVQQWLDDCERDGVIVLPPEEGWRAGLVAADLVIGDSGSVTYYGASLGRPTVLAVRHDDAVDPASAVGRFIAAAPVLTAHRSLHEQVELALRQPRSQRVAESTSLVTSVPGQSHALLRREFYRLLALPEPADPVRVPVLPIPRVHRRTVAAMAVEVHLEAASSILHAKLQRHAAGTVTRGMPPHAGAHLVVSTDEPDRALLEAAEIIAHDRPDPAGSWLHNVLRALPGAWLATLPADGREWWVGARDGTVVSFSADDEIDGRVWASVVHGWMCLGRDLREMPAEVRVTLAGRIYRATVTRVS